VTVAGLGSAHLRDIAISVLRTDDLVVEYRVGGNVVHAVSGVSLDLLPGETLGLVGESGCGKSSTARALAMLEPMSSGSVTFQGERLDGLSRRKLRARRRQLQMIFQDPISSLNPRRKVRDIVAEGLGITGVPKPWNDRVASALRAVGMDPDVIGDRRPREFSGGQCQRIAIARVLALNPSVIICDEPLSSLDVSVQAQVMNLLEDMKAEYDLSLVFISHDLAVVKNISDRVAVMYLGRLCEIGPTEQLYRDPRHPYTASLLSAIPSPNPQTTRVPLMVYGDVASPLDPPSGCRFRSRCPRAQELCGSVVPIMRPTFDGHFVACHFPLESHGSAAVLPTIV
jgi:peptide/nickel transport system ATP-binding protein